MTTRHLAIIGLKLLGLSQLFNALFLFPIFAYAFYALKSGGYFFQFLGWILIALAGFLLISKTEWFVDKLRIPEEKIDVPISPASLLQIGLVLIAIFFLLAAIPVAGGMIYESSRNYSPQNAWWFLSKNSIQLFLRIFLGTLVLVNSAKIAAKVFPRSATERN